MSEKVTTDDDILENNRRETWFYYLLDRAKDSNVSLFKCSLKRMKNFNRRFHEGDFENCILLNVDYDWFRKLIVLDFYNQKTFNSFKIKDPVKYFPYCYYWDTSIDLKKLGGINQSSIIKQEKVWKYDLISDSKVELLKITCKNPMQIRSKKYGLACELEGLLEHDILHHLSYISDCQLIPGLSYDFIDGKLKLSTENQEVKEEIIKKLDRENDDYKEFFKEYFNIFNQSIPDFRRIAMDIEVKQPGPNQFPDPEVAVQEVISISFSSNDGVREVIVLENIYRQLGQVSENIGKVKVTVYKREKDLIMRAFELMDKYPIVITFNGDQFDLFYLYNRASNLNIPVECNPIIVGRGIGMTNKTCKLKNSIHLDLYQFFRNKSVRIYVFKAKYKEFSLDAIAQALLEKNKIEHEELISDMKFYDLVYYNIIDSDITLELTTFDDNLTMKIMILFMRISKLPIMDLNRKWISAWIRQLLQWEHRKRNYLIPNYKDLQRFGLSGKELRGATVIEPKEGVYFDVVVMDFSSLYPSIIKEYNLSYETINCSHPFCITNKLISTPYHTCEKRIGIMSLITGVIRDLRILCFKPLSKDKNVEIVIRDFYKIVESALKVFINASYGVYGSVTFSFYCFPIADSTTSIGRHAVKKTSEKAGEIGIETLYGDTDSVFLEKMLQEQIDYLISWGKEELKLDLEIDKQYSFLAMTSRKKNYLGVYKEGGVDIKGLVGKKSNTPVFIRNSFNMFVKALERIKDEESLEKVKVSIYQIVKKCWFRLKRKKIPLEEFSISVFLNVETIKKIDAEEEPTIKIQHVMAARECKKLKGKIFEAGEMFQYVKGKKGAKALELAKLEDVDFKKYQSQVKTTFSQVLEALEISFDEIIGIKKLDSYMKDDKVG